MTRLPHDSTVAMIAFSPDSTRLATASTDKIVRVWDLASAREMTRLPHDSTVAMIAFSPDSTWLATASTDHMVRVWDLASAQEISHMPHGRIRVFSPDGTDSPTLAAVPRSSSWIRRPARSWPGCGMTTRSKA